MMKLHELRWVGRKVRVLDSGEVKTVSDYKQPYGIPTVYFEDGGVLQRGDWDDEVAGIEPVPSMKGGVK